jgi:hypothetical protein
MIYEQFFPSIQQGLVMMLAIKEEPRAGAPPPPTSFIIILPAENGKLNPSLCKENPQGQGVTLCMLLVYHVYF